MLWYTTKKTCSCEQVLPHHEKTTHVCAACLKYFKYANIHSLPLTSKYFLQVFNRFANLIFVSRFKPVLVGFYPVLLSGFYPF